MQESRDRKLDLLLEILLLMEKKLNFLLRTILSKDLPQIGSKETGPQLLMYCLSFFL